MPNLRRPLALTAATLTVAATLGSAVGRAQKPDPGFKGEPMQGTWGFSASGTLLPPAASAPTPVAAVGQMTFDPDTRDCVIADVVNVGGTKFGGPRTPARIRSSRPAVARSWRCTGRRGTYAVRVRARGPGSRDAVIRTDSGVLEGVAKLE